MIITDHLQLPSCIMKKHLAVFVFFVICSVTVLIQNLPCADAQDFDYFNHHHHHHHDDDDDRDHRPTEKEVEQCLNAVAKIEPCVGEIIEAILTFNFSKIGSTCCASFTRIANDCHGQHNHKAHHFLHHPWLKDHCSQYNAKSPSATPAPSN